MTFIDLEEACKALCYHCRRGEPMISLDRHAAEPGETHPELVGGWPCAASRLRRLKRWERINDPYMHGTEGIVIAPAPEVTP